MAKFDNLPNQITDLTTHWEGHSGQEVEDFLTRNLENLDKADVKSMQYDSATQTLSLYNKDKDIIASAEVSVATPTYNHSIEIKHIYIDDQDVTSKDQIQCKLGSKIELGVIYKLLAINPLTGKSNHIVGKQNLGIKIDNGGYIKYESGIQSSDEEQKIDITSLYTKTTTNTVSLKVSTAVAVEEELKIVHVSTPKSIQVLNPTLQYKGENYIINGQAGFEIVNGGGIGYIIKYTIEHNGEEGLQQRSSGLMINIPESGLNIIRANIVVDNNESLSFSPITIQVINIKDQDTFSKPLCAINNISSVIYNWEYSRLYRITVYAKGYSEDYVTITSILANTANAEDTYFNKVKTVSIPRDSDQPEAYQGNISYFFGMVGLSQKEIKASLIIKVDSDTIISSEDGIQLTISNDSQFTYTEGAEYTFDQYDPDNSNIITQEVLSNIESPDGLNQDGEMTVFRISAKDYRTPVISKNLSSSLTNNGFAFELDFKTYNISNPDYPILKLGRFILYPTEFNWQFSDNESESVDKTARSALFQEGEKTHILVEIVPEFKAIKREIPMEMEKVADRTINIVRVFINGVIDREFRYNTLSDFNLNGFNLELAPTTSDIDIYTMRIYNRALTHSEVSNNYISTLSDINSKKAFQENNAIIALDSNNDSYISYNLAKKLYNTIIYVMPKGIPYPHQFNTVKKDKYKGITTFVNYVNHPYLPYELTPEEISKCSGRFTNCELKGQGTSAMKYYWYNIQIKSKKFTSSSCYDETSASYVQPTDENPNKLFNSSKYYLPNNPTIGVSKLVGKTNYASSMQSHKLGTTNAFHDLWDQCVDKQEFSPEEIKGRKAVLEFPFLVFYIETDLEDLTNYTPADIDALPDEQIKFATFQTWGSAKGDKETFGFNEVETPGYLLLEGAENNGKLCNWLVPWMPNNIVLDGETYKTKGQNGVLQDSFDVDFGLAKDSETELTLEAQETLKKFIEAYNFCYLHTINLEPYKEAYSLNDNRNISVLDITKKYYITNSRYSDTTYFLGAQWDVFRYDETSDLWVPAGLPKLDEFGNQKNHISITDKKGQPVFDYEVFNLKTWYEQHGGEGIENINTYKQALITDFKKDFGKYFHVDDVMYHQAFIKLFAGTDNRAKNTYFKILNKNSKIQLLQDDMDTVLATDNRGLQKKPYFLIEPSKEPIEYAGMWGGESAFFELIDIAYEEEINTMLKSILEKFQVNQAPSLQNWMQKYFYYIQEYFPAIAYNYTARLAYESAQIFWENAGTVGVTWENNGQSPISQSHGSCLQSEKEFMKKRLIMFLSQAQVSNIFGREGSGISIKSSEDSAAAVAGQYEVTITPYQYLYLGYNVGSTPNLYTKERIAAGQSYKAIIKLDTTTPSYYVLGSAYIKNFENFSKIHWSTGEYSLSANRLLEMSANSKTDTPTVFQPPLLSLNTPVLKKLDLTNVKSLTTINLDKDHTPKLQEVYLTGTRIASVVLPTGSRLHTVHFSRALSELVIEDNQGLKDVQFEGLENLQIVSIDCSKVGEFNVNKFCEKLINCNKLSSVTLKNAKLSITEEALRKLIMCNKCIITGDIYIVTEAGSDTLKAITFETKQLLVNTFGDISSPTSKIRIHFQATEILDFTCAGEIYVYYQTGESGTIVRQNMFGINVASGNDVAIKQGINPYNPKVNGYLDITYFMSGVSSDIATIDQTGAITLRRESSNPATVTISMKVANSTQPIRKSVRVLFTWKAPSLGDFAYADGTFTSSYDPNKTLVGLVYAKDETNSTSGIVYIIGKEYTSEDSYYLGYSNEGKDGDQNQTIKDLYQVQMYLNSESINKYESVQNITHQDLVNNINVTTYSSQVNSTFKGMEDTKEYVNHVNTNLLPVLYKNQYCKPYISRRQVSEDMSTSWEYYIASKLDLKNLCEVISRNVWPNASSNDIMTCLLYPYFYSMNLYEPKVKSTESLHPAYQKGKWFAPSVAELSRIIYYRGYSISGSNFNSGDMVRQPISTSVPNGNGVLTTPIFSLALARATNQFPTVWTNIVGSGDNAGPNNITTSINSSASNNYSYQRMQQYSGTSYSYTNEWIVGSSQDNTYLNNTAYLNAWRLTKHQGIPFTKFNYTKNG